MNNKKEYIFSQKLNLYGQFLALYIIILMIFIFIRCLISDSEEPLTSILYEPLVMLMLIIIALNSIALLILTIKKRQVIFGKSYIIFRNRFFSKKILFKDIESIRISRSPSKVVNSGAMLIRIKVKNKKKIYLVRNASFNEEKKLLHLFVKLREKMRKIQ
ncbi:MAG: hypothetical protein GX372_05940 [Ignavibacteria bacterium]|jgi:hypothetical protein|nr:hypothetical protein [Ignavibacteria bacterium]